MIIFDIETGPLDDEQLLPLLPEFQPPPAPGEFDPASVKVGNLGEAKAKEKIEAARVAHASAVANYDATIAAAAINHLADFRSKAALSPLTGRVLAIGFRSDKGFRIEDGGGDEEELLNRFWATYAKCRAAQTATGPRKMLGWNILGFDLPFLIKRSWFHQVEFPRSVFDGRNFDSLFVDLMQQFTPGAWREYTKLDTAARFFGCGAKPVGTNGQPVNGGDFARLWLGTAEEKQEAIGYLQNDLEMTAAVGQRMGVAA